MSTCKAIRCGRLVPLLSMALLLMTGAFGASVSANEYTIGLMCDRSGVTGTIGNLICPGFHDYIKLFNKQQRLPGHTLKVMEIDHGYNVPRGVEAYERFKQAGVMSIALYGTPHTVALTPKLSEDQVLGTSPGFGSAAGANGEKFPYLFPAAASYWSQVASAVKFIEDNWKGGKQPRIAYIYYDNPAGREPLPIVADLQKQLGFELQSYAVPAPGIEMRPQVLDITRKFKADWVVAHFFGQTGVALKEFSRMGHPRDQMIGLVWAGGESDMKVAGWDKADGYYTVQMAHVGKDHPVNQEIVAMYKEEGKAAPEEMELSVYYNRGVSWAALHSEAIRTAVAARGPGITPVDVKNAMQGISGYSERNFMPPFKMSPQDHEGGGYVRIFQVRNGGFRPATDWMQGYRDVVMRHVLAGE